MEMTMEGTECLSEKVRSGSVNELTKKETAIQKHRKMWYWLADETMRLRSRVGKTEYFIAMGYQTEQIPRKLCFACDFALQKAGKGNNFCAYCPLDWGNPQNKCITTEYDGLFDKWINSREYEEAARIARKIAELPVREEDSL